MFSITIALATVSLLVVMQAIANAPRATNEPYSTREKQLLRCIERALQAHGVAGSTRLAQNENRDKPCNGSESSIAV